MDFAGAIKAGFQNYANFRGVASRSAFWYWRLFITIVNVGTTFLPVVGQIASIGLFLPDLAISIRRTRDAGFSAWLQLLWLIPVGLGLYALPAAFAYGSSHPIDFETATDSQLVHYLTPLFVMALPAFLTAVAVQLFFFVTYLLPTRQGNKLVK